LKAARKGGPCLNDDGIDAWIKDEAIRMVRHVEARVRSIGGGPDVAMRLLSDAFTAADAEAAAGQWADAQARLESRALRRVAAGRGLIPEVVVLSGHGTALAVRGLALTGWDAACESLSDRLGPSVSRVAPAPALAAIARGDLP
jgi:hypothetical protein